MTFNVGCYTDRAGSSGSCLPGLGAGAAIAERARYIMMEDGSLTPRQALDFATTEALPSVDHDGQHFPDRVAAVLVAQTLGIE